MLAWKEHLTKYIVEEADDFELVPMPQKRPHITVACCFNAIGAKLPLMILLNSIENIKFSQISSYPETLFATHPYGYMSNDLFLSWSAHFCDFIAEYRKFLPPNKATKQIILLLDSHTSKTSIEALKLLYRCNITAITFPSHCTHVMQPFDVVIAKSLKSKFSKAYNEINKKLKIKVTEEIHRDLAIQAIHIGMGPGHNKREGAKCFCNIRNVAF